MLQTKATSRVYWWLAPNIYRLKNCRDYSKYEVPIDPLQLLYVDPDDVKRFSPRTEDRLASLYDLGSIKGGDWDLGDTTRIKDTEKYKSMKKHFIKGVPWSDTPLYQTLCSRVASGEVVWHGCSTVSDIESRFEELESIFASISQNGYKTQPELREPRPSIHDPFGFMNERINEIAVDIGRNGEMMLLDNRHRLIMAQLLGLEEIPVCVITRHKSWVELLERSYLNGEPVHHPDWLY